MLCISYGQFLFKIFAFFPSFYLIGGFLFLSNRALIQSIPKGNSLTDFRTLGKNLNQSTFTKKSELPFFLKGSRLRSYYLYCSAFGLALKTVGSFPIPIGEKRKNFSELKWPLWLNTTGSLQLPKAAIKKEIRNVVFRFNISGSRKISTEYFYIKYF